MEGISQFQAPKPIVTQAPQNPWNLLVPSLLQTLVSSAITSAIKSKLEQQPQRAQEEKMQQERIAGTKDIETMKEKAASGRLDTQNMVNMLINGWRVGPDGQWIEPKQGTATDVTGGPTGYTPVYENGKLSFIPNKPKVTLQLPPTAPGVPGQVIPDVDPDTAATVGGTLAKPEHAGQFTTNEIIGKTNEYWKEQASLVDKTYGMTDSRGNLIIDPAQKDEWLKERTEIEKKRLSDHYGIAGGQKPSWMTTPPADPNKAYWDNQVKGFINNFGGTQ